MVRLIGNLQKTSSWLPFVNALLKAKSRFLATMSHEIRSPLNAVLGSVELLLGSTLQKEQRIYATTAKEAGDALLNTINDILDFSKIEAGKVTLEKVNFSLTGLLNGLIDTFVIKIADKGIEMIVHVEKDIPECVEGVACMNQYQFWAHILGDEKKGIIVWNILLRY